MAVAPNPDLGVVRDKLFRDFECSVRRSVIHDQDFELGGQLAAHFEQLVHMVA
jgi:hypothetical protein